TQAHGTGGSGAPSANIPPDGRERCREAEGSDRPLTLTVTHLAVTHLAVAHLGHSPRRRHPELCKDVAIRAGTHHFAEVDGQVGELDGGATASGLPASPRALRRCCYTSRNPPLRTRRWASSRARRRRYGHRPACATSSSAKMLLYAPEPTTSHRSMGVSVDGRFGRWALRSDRGPGGPPAQSTIGPPYCSTVSPYFLVPSSAQPSGHCKGRVRLERSMTARASSASTGRSVTSNSSSPSIARP